MTQSSSASLTGIIKTCKRSPGSPLRERHFTVARMHGLWAACHHSQTGCTGLHSGARVAPDILPPVVDVCSLVSAISLCRVRVLGHDLVAQGPNRSLGPVLRPNFAKHHPHVNLHGRLGDANRLAMTVFGVPTPELSDCGLAARQVRVCPRLRLRQVPRVEYHGRHCILGLKVVALAVTAVTKRLRSECRQGFEPEGPACTGVQSPFSCNNGCDPAVLIYGWMLGDDLRSSPK